MGLIKDTVLKVMDPEININQQVNIGARLSFYVLSNNALLFCLDNKAINYAYSKVKLKDGTIIDSKDCKYHNINVGTLDNDSYFLKICYIKDNYELVQHLQFKLDSPYFIIDVCLKSNEIIESNYMVALDFGYPNKYFSNQQFFSLNQRMLYVPFDNDMWAWYESGPLNPGKTSYEITAIYDKTTDSGLVIGALDFDFWKNGIVCSHYDARCFSAVSGIADGFTHDCLEHGYAKGTEIKSSRFVCGYYQDVKAGLEEYGKLAANPQGLTWTHGVPFGWNSYSALTLETTIEHYNQAADFLYEKLPEFKSEENVTYINFDAVVGISQNKMKEAISRLHKRHQKAGTYLAPVAHLPIMDLLPLKDNILKFRKDIVLKKPNGENYPPIDGKYPIDITHPDAEKDLRKQLQTIVKLGFDYLKIDFTTHGCLEGVRYNKDIVTGRQALNYFYEILKDELAKANHEIFVSFSISPLFPGGYAHARRCCCDSFGHHEDVEYILNALTYGWWTNGSIYTFNDPDHTVLYHSLVDGRKETTYEEAKSRYLASIIAGTVMLLSDNYGPSENEEMLKKAQERTIKLANNKKLNDIARLGLAFKPYKLHDENSVFYLNHEQKTYVAIFNTTNQAQVFTINPLKVKAPESGNIVGLSEDIQTTYSKLIKVKVLPYDSLLIEFN